MFDTHCHLTDPNLFSQLTAVLARAAGAGVSRMVTIGTHPTDWQRVIDLVKDRPAIRCAIGVHPNYCHEVDFGAVSDLRQLQQNPEVVALGEMGLDYHHHFAPKARQTEFFLAQLQIAQEVDRPVVIHCREAVDDCLAILAGFGKIRAVFHCFTGTADEAKRIFALGHFIGFTGVVTFKNGQALRDIAAAAPRDQILVETDAPYLTPEPMRKQKINEPAMVMHTAAVVAAARKVSLEELDARTSDNARRFYRWE
ncbi:MAG: TatD family hydrolase [Planctomycetota bacterium]|nr:TatD family hydrolase [Planctomycetota bacterium]